MGGTEMILPILLSEGVAKGRLTLERLVEVTSVAPARLFGLFPGRDHAGQGIDADFAVVDPDLEWTATPGELHSRCDYTPYEGLRVRGRVVATVAGGRIIFRNGKFRGRTGDGRYLERRRTETPGQGRCDEIST